MEGTETEASPRRILPVPDDAAFQERRHASGGVVARRAAVGRAIGRHRLEDFQNTLTGIAIAVFGEQATVVAHLRNSSGRQWVTFVVDAADPASVVQYEDFVPRERAFWTGVRAVDEASWREVHGGDPASSRVVPSRSARPAVLDDAAGGHPHLTLSRRVWRRAASPSGARLSRDGWAGAARPPTRAKGRSRSTDPVWPAGRPTSKSGNPRRGGP